MAVQNKTGNLPKYWTICHAKYKYMENTITINPTTDEMRVLAHAVKIRNEFTGKGFASRGAFIQIVQEKLPEYKDYHKVRDLENWWLIRLKDDALNKKLESVIENLRHE